MIENAFCIATLAEAAQIRDNIGNCLYLHQFLIISPLLELLFKSHNQPEELDRISDEVYTDLQNR